MRGNEVEDVDFADSLVAVEYATAVVRERWKPAILWLVATGKRRFSQLQRALPTATHKMLSQQLQDLVRDGILRRWSAERGRRHVEYELTPAGEALRPVLSALEAWGRENPRSTHMAVPSSPRPTKLELAKPLHAVREHEAPTQSPAERSVPGRSEVRRVLP